MIIDKLIEKIKETKNPTVIGLDPRLEYIPEFLKKKAYEKHGATLKGAAKAIYSFNKKIIDETCDIVPAVKPQIAMYEQFGCEGIKAFIKTIAYAKKKGLMVIGDIKRGDIASTAEAYSDGHIGETDVFGKSFTVFDEDIITLNPYLGYDSIEPYMENCKKFERGMFILVKTSNPNSAEIQDLLTDGKPLYEKVGELVAGWGKEHIGSYGYSHVGAVVGATHPEQAKKLRKIMPNTFFLVPGYGAQGGTAKDLAVCFDKNGLGAIVNSSRGIIAAYKSPAYKNEFSEIEFAKAARQAAIDMQKDLLVHVKLK